jgi:nitroreductase
MEIVDCILNRRTVRNYKEEKIEKNIVKECINKAVYAPSACNFQAWKFIYIDNKLIINDICKWGGSKVIGKSNQCICLIYRNDIKTKGRKFGDDIQSASAAIMNLQLIFNEKGIGCAWICDLPEKNILKSLLKIPENFDVISFVTFGYPAETCNSIERINYHFESKEEYNKHKRKFTSEQIFCDNGFSNVDGDCTNYEYVKKPSIINKIKKYIWKQINWHNFLHNTSRKIK